MKKATKRLNKSVLKMIRFDTIIFGYDTKVSKKVLYPLIKT